MSGRTESPLRADEPGPDVVDQRDDRTGHVYAQIILRRPQSLLRHIHKAEELPREHDADKGHYSADDEA